MKKLSIVTINYNNRDELNETLSSFCTKAYLADELELLIIDGGSTDGSLEVLDKYKSFIDYQVSEPDGGIFPAMNKGLKQATGEYIIFMNSGDAFCEGLLTRSFLNGLQGDIFYGDLYLKTGNHLTYQKQTPEIDFLYLLGRTICHQSVFMRTALAQQYPFTTAPEYSIMGDWIQLFQIMRQEKAKVLYAPVPICLYDTSGVSDQEPEQRQKQRLSYLRTQYSEWELKDLIKISRLRSRETFPWIISTLNSYRKQKTLKLISKLL